jgi:NAD(P)-dependent dehydrogenase (short-subunit alcohol dehydrogenase family)
VRARSRPTLRHHDPPRYLPQRSGCANERELAPKGVRVNAIAPGVIDTPLIEPAMRESLKTRSPMNRIGAPQQIVDAALYLVDAEFTTGVVLPVDGVSTAGRW